MNIDSDTKLYCLIGHPISKSLSPLIHNFSFNENKINAKYLTFDVKENNLKMAISGLKALGVQGFNVTIPYKTEIIQYLDELSEEAKLIGSVNTVKNVNGKLIGYNTDGMGFIESLKENKIEIKEKIVLVIGAGGAGRAICMMLAKEGAEKIHIINRTIDKAKKLSKELNSIFDDVLITYGSLDNKKIDFKNIDIVVNCTSVGMYPNIDETPINPNHFTSKTTVYDIIYKPIKTKFLKFAEKRGCKILNGLDMLIYQGILSEEIWLDMNLNVEKVKKNVKSRSLQR